MRCRIALAVALLAPPAFAQTYYNGQPPQQVTPADVTSAIAAAMPSPCGAVPAFDTLTGTPGFGTPCMARPDAARPTPVQAANTATSDAAGSWSVTFGRAFTSAAPIVHAEPVQPGGSTLPYACGVTSRTTTSASGTCWAATSQSTPLSVSIVTAGLTVASNPYAAKVPQGTVVMVVAREPTQ